MLVCCFLAIVTAVSRIGKKDGSSLKYIASYLKDHKVEISALVVVFLVGFFWATSTKVTLNEHVIFELHLSDFLMKKLSIFRASGRFIWGPCLIVMTTALWIVSKLEFKTAITAVFICAWLQGMDVRSVRNVMLSSGKGRTDALYVFFKEEDIPSDVDNIIVYDIGEYKVARVKK